MSDSFTFYRSFYEAIDQLGEKAQLKLYKSIMKLCLNRCKNIAELEQLCDEIETELKQNRNVFAQFLLMKPHLIKSAKAGLMGVLGGAPEDNLNAKKTTNIEDKDKDKDKDKKQNIKEGAVENSVFNSNFYQNRPNPDLMFDLDIEKAFKIYEEECKELIPLGFIKRDPRKRLKIKEFLNVISGDFTYFRELCQKANKLKVIASHKIDIDSLINNYSGIMSGKYIQPNAPPESEENLIKTAQERQQQRRIKKDDTQP